jgi:hypothetical protein
MRIAKSRGWSAVLGLSGSIWLLAQFNLRGWAYAAAAHFGFPIPLKETGAFDLFGWQFLWTAGLYLGSSKAASLFSKFRIPQVRGHVLRGDSGRSVRLPAHGF